MECTESLKFAMTDEEFSDLINEKHRLKWELRQLTKNVQKVQKLLDRIDEIDRMLSL